MIDEQYLLSKAVPIGQTVYCEVRREKHVSADDDPLYILYSNATQEPLLYCMRTSFSEHTISTGKPSDGLFWDKAVGRLKFLCLLPNDI